MANLNEPRAGCPGGAAGFSRGSAARPSCMRCAIPVHKATGTRCRRPPQCSPTRAPRPRSFLDEEAPAEPGYHVIRRHRFGDAASRDRNHGGP